MNYCAECAKDINASTVPGVVMGVDGKTWYCDKHKPDLFYSSVPVEPLRDAVKPISFNPAVTIKNHSGNKYLRKTVPPAGCEPGVVDVYAVLDAFNVTCPGIQHALKKLLCVGIRGKATALQDITEAIDALHRSVEMQKAREANSSS